LQARSASHAPNRCCCQRPTVAGAVGARGPALWGRAGSMRCTSRRLRRGRIGLQSALLLHHTRHLASGPAGGPGPVPHHYAWSLPLLVVVACPRRATRKNQAPRGWGQSYCTVGSTLKTKNRRIGVRVAADSEELPRNGYRIRGCVVVWYALLFVALEFGAMQVKPRVPLAVSAKTAEQSSRPKTL
jgi:hypothetical protein